MRYSDDVKLFWRTGMQLFHGRFLRFMSGPKSKGQLVATEATPGNFDPEKSKLNFAVPDRKVLSDSAENIIQSKTPGIFHKMIESIAKLGTPEVATYKICIDGKKINPSSKGEVNLWGFEKEPTYESKLKRLSCERQYFQQSYRRCERFMELCHSFTTELSNDDQACLVEICRNAIKKTSERIKDLRRLKVRRELALKKLQEKIEGDWKQSRYAIVISSIRTAIYRIGNCIDDLLMVNENLISHASKISVGFANNATHILLQNQENYICLNETPSHNHHPHLVKQRSKEWFDLRKKSLVTGSTIYKAIGMESLKKQREFLEEAKGKKPAPVSEDLQRKFDHGVKNEINALATFVGKFLPAFNPELEVYEEGCYVIESEEEIKLVVSPDGSVRKQNDEDSIVYGIEIKCPTPDKLYTTQIQYELPFYYVTQVLGEMKVLGVDSLYFLSYTEASMAIHIAKFDEDLWNMIYSEILELNVNKCLTKTKPNIPLLREKVRNYTKVNVTFLAEIKSCTGTICSHAMNSKNQSRIRHVNEKAPVDCCGEDIGNLAKSLTKCEELVEQSHTLCVHRASEVLVFVLSDLDRISKPESIHSYPIGYGLRGYSMTSDAMRNLIQQTLNTLFLNGLYTPAVAYDGEWAPIAFKTADGMPLTVLELQKQVYNEVKMKNKSSILKQIFETAIVKSTHFEDMMTQISVERIGKVLVLGTKGDYKLFCTSNHIADLLKRSVQSEDKTEDEGTDNGSTSDILSSIPPETLVEVDDQVMETLKSIDFETQPCVLPPKNTQLCQLLEPCLFDDEDMEPRPISALEHSPNLIDEGATSEAEIVDDSTITELSNGSNVINHNDLNKILSALQENQKSGSKWMNKSTNNLERLLGNKDLLNAEMTKDELMVCLSTVQESLDKYGIKYFKSWVKTRLAALLHRAYSSPPWTDGQMLRQRRKKDVLHLDVHHLMTNCRIKMCKDGFPERNINKQAWIEVARENSTNLKVPHVEDLIDKQSDSIAKETFSRDVQVAMERLGYKKEAQFCELIRRFYEAEDEPGISAVDRCYARLALREWMLEGVNFSKFPPYGLFVKGIPHVMFQGFLTNIDRRIQIIPYTKTGKYNVRALGTLEIENSFGNFQDLDPKGSGVIKAEDVPIALESACKLLTTKLMPDRKFHMSLSKAKVYPLNELMEDDDSVPENRLFVYPCHTTVINVMNHLFDSAYRSKRKPRRKLACIAKVDDAARGVLPVRQHHRIDESKILPHKREGILLD